MKSYSEFITEQAQRVGTYTKLTRADGGLDIVTKHLNINDSASKGEIPMTEKFAKEKDEERKARTGLSSLAITDAESKAVQKTPNRISLADIESAIVSTEFMHPTSINHMTICIVKLGNGFALVGHSTPADSENFDLELGRKFAYENAIRQAWPLFAFALREQMSQREGPYTGEAVEVQAEKPYMTEGQREAAADITGNRNRL